MNDIKTIASLVAGPIDVSPSQLLQQFASNNEYIYYESFSQFCREQGVIVESHEFLDLLDANQTYLFQEYSDCHGRYWTPVLVEGYVSNMLPGDWDDFGDDQIEGITKPAFGDGAQQQPSDFEPLSNAQISDDPDSEQIPDDSDPGEADLPDFDTRIRHRPSRSTKELESRNPEDGIIEQDNGPLIAQLYGLVDSWQTGAMDKTMFDSQLDQLSKEPTLKNDSRDIKAMVQGILAARAQQ